MCRENSAGLLRGRHRLHFGSWASYLSSPRSTLVHTSLHMSIVRQSFLLSLQSASLQVVYDTQYVLQQREILTFQQWVNGLWSFILSFEPVWLVSRWSYLPNLLHFCTFCIYVLTYFIAWYITIWYCIAGMWHDSTLQRNDETWHEMIRSIYYIGLV